MRYIIALALILAMTGCTDEEPTDEYQGEYFQIVVDKVEPSEYEFNEMTFASWKVTFRVEDEQGETLPAANGARFRCVWENKVSLGSPLCGQLLEIPGECRPELIEDQQKTFIRKTSAPLGVWTGECPYDATFGKLEAIDNRRPGTRPGRKGRHLAGNVPK